MPASTRSAACAAARAARSRRGVPPLLLPALLSSALLVLPPAALPASARSPIAIPPQLRLSAMQCLAEGLRLCPRALSAKDHDLACVLAKRHLLSAPCRALSDQALGLLRGGDLHLDLRRPKPRRTAPPPR